MQYILASASPRRKELLGRLGIPFEISVSNADESVPAGTKPVDAAAFTAEKKARAVAANYPDACVIGADTIVVLGDTVMGKPADAADAVKMLTALSGKTHQVMTGVALIQGGKTVTFTQVTDVTFYPLSGDEIKAYVASGEPMDKAGAYGIQGLGCTLVEGIRGDYFNVVGLPVARLARAIKELNG